MGYKLEKPFTNIERADFVCEHQGLMPIEIDSAFYMLEVYEELQNGEIINISNTDEYIMDKLQEQIDAIMDEYVTAIASFDNIWCRNVILGIKTAAQYETARNAIKEEYFTRMEELENG